MFARKDKPTAQPARLPKQPAPVVDLLAVITGTGVTVLGVIQIFAAPLVAPLSGIDGGIAGEILALQWVFLGVLLLLGGVARARVISIFAAEFLLLASLAAIAILLWNDPSSFAVITHAVLAVLAFVSSGFARLTERSDMKREIGLARDQARTPEPAKEPAGTEGDTGQSGPQV